MTAWPRMLLTSLITGASSADGAHVGDLELSVRLLFLLLVEIASATVLWSVLSRPISASMSPPARPRRRQLSPVAICTSSSASTLAGSAIASSSVLSSTKPTGTA